MKNFTRLQTGLDLSAVYDEVMANEHLFVEIPRTLKPWQVGYTHKGLQLLNMRINRMPEGDIQDPKVFKKFSDDLFCHNLPCYNLFPNVKSLIYSLMADIEGTHIGRLASVRLLPGDSILGHIDTGLSSDYYSRYHIILEGVEDNWAQCGDEWVEMKTGEIWTFNHKIWHSFINQSDRPRIYINVDIAL